MSPAAKHSEATYSTCDPATGPPFATARSHVRFAKSFLLVLRLFNEERSLNGEPALQARQKSRVFVTVRLVSRFILLVYRFCKRQLFLLPSGILLKSYTRKDYVESRLHNRSSAQQDFYPFIR